MAYLNYYYSISCSKLYIVAICSCLELVHLFQFLWIGILTYMGNRNFSFDLVGITDFLHAQYALLCDLFISHKKKHRLALSELVEASHLSLCLFIFKPKRKKAIPVKHPVHKRSFSYIETRLVSWDWNSLLFWSQCSSIQTDYNKFLFFSN